MHLTRQIQRARMIEGKRPLENLPHVEEPMTGIRPVTTVRRRPAEAMPFPIRWEEEGKMTPGDILVTVEHCTACARHRMSLHHNADAYIQRAAAVQGAVGRALSGAGRPPSASGRDAGQTTLKQSSPNTSVLTKAVTERSASGGVGRVGAFEVQVTACLLAEQAQEGRSNVRLRLRTIQSPAPSTCKGVVRSLTVSSKLSSGKWPSPDGVARKVVEILHDWGALRQPQLNPESDSRSACRDAPSTRGREESSMGVKECTAAAAHGMHVAGAQNRYLGKDSADLYQTDYQSEKPSDKPSTAAPSGLVQLGMLNENTAVPSTAAGASQEGEQQAGTGMSRDGLMGGVVVGRGAASPATSSVYVALLQGDDIINAAGELATGTAGVVPGTPATVPSVFALSVENAFAEGVEFAAEGSTADPCFLVKMGSHNSKKSDPVPDVRGGSGGECRWSSEVCSVAGLREVDLRSSGLEVEIWDDLGWIIAKGKMLPEDVRPVLEAGLASLPRAAA
ncbi:unnamed protein product, partial [Hapterophycus canaliculatus]